MRNKRDTLIRGFSGIADWVIYGICCTICIIILAWISWLTKTPMVFNLAWTWWRIIIFLLIFAVVGSLVNNRENSWSDANFHLIFYVLALITFVILVIGSISSKPISTAKERYHYVNSMVTVIDDSQDAFPNLLGENNDTSNLPLIGVPEAIKKAETEMGKISGLGSQFQLLKASVTSQNINNSLMYVIPLEPKDFIKWDEEGNRGYFVIDRNNGNTAFIQTSLMTTEQAPYGDNAKRIIYGYLSSIGKTDVLITEISPELNDNGDFYYVASVYTVDGIGGLKRVVGIVELNAVTKACQYYDLDEIPEYVDRVYPESFFEDYLEYYGAYKNGYWNSVFEKKDVLEMTNDFDVIYIDGECFYYTGYTTAGKGKSSNGIMMMNCRTGEIFYHVTYGISESNAMGVAKGRVQDKGYIASYPLLLKVAEEETYFMLMRDSNENICGYAFVNYKDYNKAAVGTTLLSAQEEYIKSLQNTNSAENLENKSLTKISGLIEEIATEIKDGNTVYYVIIRGHEHKAFSFYSELAPKILFAKPHVDTITIQYVETASVIIPAVTVEIEYGNSNFLEK